MRPRSRAPKPPKSRPAVATPIYTLVVTLVGMEPPIWRRLQVSGSLTLERLDIVIQKAMGWHNAHLHEFIVGKTRYAVPIPEEPE